jgi:hypothetical protein
MTTKERKQQADEADDRERQRLCAAIGRHVVVALGQPDDFLQVQVRGLWGGHYRVNVLVGANAASARVAHSFFLTADGGGNVLTSTPALARLY